MNAIDGVCMGDSSMVYRKGHDIALKQELNWNIIIYPSDEDLYIYNSF